MNFSSLWSISVTTLTSKREMPLPPPTNENALYSIPDVGALAVGILIII